MKLIGLSGWSGSGKTTLLVQLIPELTARGLAVSTIKHAHHGFDVDQPGKDSYAHRTAGAHEVMVASAQRWALMHEHRGAPEPTLSDLVQHMNPVDLLLVEGFKNDPHDKIEVFRRAVGKPLQCGGDPHIVAVVSDGPVPETGLPVIGLDDVSAIADFVLGHCGLTGLAGAA
jgi:molybdopterin-guanine dinucleotide biosynthesis protein B